MRFTHYQLLHNGLRAFPALTTVGGVATAYLLFGIGEEAGQSIYRELIIGGIMGLLGGVAVSSLGQAALHHVNVEDDPRYKERRRQGNSQFIQSKITKVYSKADLEDHEKSTSKTIKKLQEKAKADKAERAQILEIGTQGLEQKKKEKLGIKSSSVSKSDVNKSGKKKK
jgi:hypothetical protein